MPADRGDRPVATVCPLTRGRRAFTSAPSKSRAQMAELVDAHGSGPCAARRGGSSPLLGTSTIFVCIFQHPQTSIKINKNRYLVGLRVHECSLVSASVLIEVWYGLW